MVVSKMMSAFQLLDMFEAFPLTNLGSRPVAGCRKKGVGQRVMDWVDSKILVYNVTSGLYMLDWWERVLFNTLFFLLLWFVCYKGSEVFVSSGIQIGRGGE